MWAKQPDICGTKFSIFKDWMVNHLIYQPNGIGELRKDLYQNYKNGIVKKEDRVSSKIFTQTLLFISWYTLRWYLINNVDRYVQMLNVKLKK